MTELKTAIDLNPSTSVASEDYLEQILNLVTEKGYARVIDIATNLYFAGQCEQHGAATGK